MEIKTFIDAKVNREKHSKIKNILDGKYKIFIEEKEEWNLFDKTRLAKFLFSELDILDEEFKKL